MHGLGGAVSLFFLTRSAQMWPQKLSPFCGNLEIFNEKDMKQKLNRDADSFLRVSLLSTQTNKLVDIEEFFLTSVLSRWHGWPFFPNSVSTDVATKTKTILRQS